MNETAVSIMYDREKVDALRVYLGHKNTTLDIELQKAMDSLFTTVVPAVVREFIHEKDGSKYTLNPNGISAPIPNPIFGRQ